MLRSRSCCNRTATTPHQPQPTAPTVNHRKQIAKNTTARKAHLLQESGVSQNTNARRGGALATCALMARAPQQDGATGTKVSKGASKALRNLQTMWFTGLERTSKNSQGLPRPSKDL